MRKSLLGLGLSLALTLGAAAQELSLQPVDPSDNPRTPAKVALGNDLFHSPLLSANRKISCATCHDPEMSFADSRARSLGVFETEIKRNSPTLWGIGLTHAFPAHAASKDPKAENPLALVALDLEARCVAPIENPVEMGSSVEEAVKALRALTGMNKRFDEAFGKRGRGVTGDRLGKALAAYLRDVQLPDTPYQRFLKGDHKALDEAQMRGLALFEGPAQCTQCHSGPRLSDGLLHAVMPLDAPRTRSQARMEQFLAQEFRAKQAALKTGRRTGRGGRSATLEPQELPTAQTTRNNPYGGGQGTGGTTPSQRFTSVQTPSLWDVARTGPWFRDGSAEDLELAVRQHMDELRGLRTDQSTIRIPDVAMRNGCADTVITPSQLFTQARSGLPEVFQPNWTTLTAQPAPARLGEQAIADIVAFLHALSPPHQR